MGKINILVAYPYMSKPAIKFLQEHYDKIRFVLDSGAFTAWKAEKPIELDDYCNFIEKLPFKPWRYFTLDKIGDPKGSLKNYEIMLKRDLNPVPIFTRGEDISMIDEYYKTSDVLGIGGLVGTKENKGFVKGIMKVVGDRKVHWLGFTNTEFVKYFRPYMCDTSSWESSAKYGSFRLYKGNGKFINMSKKDFSKKPDQEVLDIISTYGIDPYSFSREASWRGGRSQNRILNALSAVRASSDFEDKLGTKLFMAAAGKLALELLITGGKK